MIKLSFILPCYNVSPYVGRCIESIEAQDIPQTEYEVICIDDCSKDNTVEMIKEYQKRYSNIRLICHTENKTAGGARNTGIEDARGEYIWFVDPDDAIVPDKSVKLYEYAHKNDLDILVFNYSVSHDGNSVYEIEQLKEETEILKGQDFFLEYFPQRRMAEVVSLGRQLYKRYFCVKYGIRYPEIKSSQDVVFEWTAFLKADRMGAMPITGFITYRRPTSTTGSIGMYKAINLISASILYSNKIKELIDTLPMYEQYKEDLWHEIKLSVNDEARKILRMQYTERNLFLDQMRKHNDLVDKFIPLMNRRNRILYNYHLPRVIWNMMVVLYRNYDKIFRRR